MPQRVRYEGRATGQVSAVQAAFLCLAGKRLLLPLPGQRQAGFLPQRSSKPRSSPSSRVLAPPFIYAARLAVGWLLICLASPTPLCLLPCVHGWRIRLGLPFPRLLAAEAFPACSPLLLLLGSLCELCS